MKLLSSRQRKANVFISYRRDDSPGHAGRLYDRLSFNFSQHRIFMDIDNIGPGKDFVAAIEDAVASCDILIAVIGKYWLAREDGSVRQLDHPNDFVSLEIRTALSRGIRVIPVLMQGGRMPRAQDLPDTLQELARLNAYEISDSHWKYGVDQLLKVMQQDLRHSNRDVSVLRRALLLYMPQNPGGMISRILFYLFLGLVLMVTLGASLDAKDEFSLATLVENLPLLIGVSLFFGIFIVLLHKLAVLFDRG